MRLIKEQLDREKAWLTLISARVIHSTHAAQPALRRHVKILMRYIPLATVTHFTLKCASFLFFFPESEQQLPHCDDRQAVQG